MKKFVLSAIGLLASLLSAQAQVFAPTNLVVMTLGGPGQALATSGNAMNLAQYTTTGTLLNTVTIPGSGTNALICGGTAVTEGYLSLSANGEYLVWGGYNTNLGSYTVALSTTGSSTNFRGVGTLDGYGDYTLQYAGSVLSGASIRSAASDGSNNFWIDGGNTGIIYVGNKGPVATVFNASVNQRCLNIFNGNLYFSTGSATGVPGTGFWEVPGLPTTSGGGSLYTAGGQIGAVLPEDFVVNTNLGIAYLCDYDTPAAGGGVIRYTLTGGIWTSNYTLSTGSGAYAVVANWSGANPVLYVTVGSSSVASGNTLVTITDTGASSASTLLATAPAGETFRGLSWAPGSAPLITAQPVSITNDYGQTGVFSVNAGGSAPVSYQWYSNSTANPTFVAIPSATAATLTLPNLVAAESNSMFYVVVSNAYGTLQSSTATLTVDPPSAPINVTVTPATQTVNAEGQAVFNVSFAGGLTSLTYGWKHNGTPLVNGNLGVSTISGATTPTLTISSAAAIDDGSYTAYVTNSLGSGNNSANPATLAVNDPTILTNVMGETNFPNSGPVSLSVAAIGTSLTYQWLANGVAIFGANSSTYTVPNSIVSNTTLYSVVVTSSSGGSVTNGPVIVSFTPYLLYDTFSYPNGDLFGDPGSPWTDINGTNPELVTGGRVQISQNNATTDAQSLYDQAVNGTVVWASFTLNVSQLPSNPGGIYFANFEDTNFGFYGRLFLLTSNSSGLTPDIAPVAYPGTYRIGIANDQNDSAPSAATGPSAVVELDMAPGIDYNVVEYYDLANGFCQMAVNPSQAEYNQITYLNSGASPNALTSGACFDTFKQSGLPMAAYGLRQRTAGGIMQMDNLEVSYDWNGAGSGFTAVTAGVAPTKAIIGLLTPSFTNYSGNSNVLEVAASGIDLTYAWYQNGVALSDGNSVSGSSTAALTLNPTIGTNSGSYTVVIHNAAGSVTSAVVAVSINTTVTAPSFTLPGGLEPQSTTVAEGGKYTFTANAVGTGPITYAWSFNGSPNGVTGPSLTLTGISPSQAGAYTVTATGGTGLATTSSSAVLTVTAPVATNIGYLRSLLTPGSTPTISDTTTLYSITGVVTTATNLTSGTTTSCYLQDSTGGINLFVTGDSTFRPQLGDIVTATGTLSVYFDNLELDVVAGAEFQVYQDLGSGATPPTPILLPWTAVASPNGIVGSDLDFIQTNVEGSVVTMTNVYFETSGIFTNSTSGYPITNNAGLVFNVFVTTQPDSLQGMAIPPFAASVTGPLYQDGAIFSIIVTTMSEIVLPSATVTITNLAGAVSASGTGLTLTWTAVPTTASYSVLYSTNAAGPYTNKLATGLTFGTTAGTYTTTPTNAANFYEISSP